MTMVSKSQSKISVNGEEALSALRKVNAAKDSPGIPTGSSITAQAPPTYSATSYFNSGITNYSQDLRVYVDELRLRLSNLHDDIKQTVTEFAARDASVSDEAAALLGSIESIPVVTNSYTPTSSNPADSAASKSGY
jgi:hypothetical protein